MTRSAICRRTLVQVGSAALAGVSVLRLAGPTRAVSLAQDDVVIPWLDQPEPNPVPEVMVQQLDWEQLDAGAWLTPTDQFFVIKDFTLPEVSEADWRLEIDGLVDQPLTWTLDDLKARERQVVTVTLECPGNTGLPFFTGGIGNAAWAGTPLAALLEEAGVQEPGIEVIFLGSGRR